MLGGTAIAWAQQAEAEQAVRFSIPAQSLPSAVDAFTRATGWQVGYSATVDSAVTTNRVSGRQTPRQALQAMFAGTGVSIRFTGPKSAALVTPQVSPMGLADDGSLMLDTIDVTAETARGPVDGYVAQQSATATKTDTPIIDTPQTISVITADEIADQQAQSVRDVVRYAPGVYYSDDADSRLQLINARGFLLDQYLDGLSLLTGTWARPRIDPYFLERAEVLEGPSSTLYGQGSPGGLLNMISKRPTETPHHQVEIQTGSYDRIQGAFDLGGPVDDQGRVLYRVTGLARKTGTQVDHVDEERLAIAPSVTWRPNADTSLTLLASYLHDPKAGFWNLLPYQGTLLPNKYGKFSRDFYVGDVDFEDFDFKQGMVGYELTHRFNDTWSVRQNFRYTGIETDYRAVQGSTLQADQRTLNRNAYTADESLDAVTLDNQATANFNTGALTHTALFGADYQYRNWDNLSRFGLAPTLDILHPDYTQDIAIPPLFQDANQVQEQVGLYAQDQIEFGRFYYSIGGREDWASSDTNNYLAGTKTDQDNSKFTWNTGLLYHFDSGFAPYVSYATSFQPTIGTDFAGRPFDPTTGEQYEAGIKYQPPSMDALFTASIFELTQQNVLTADPNPSHSIGSQVQTGEVRSRGIELSAVASLTDSLDARASYTHLDSEITRSNDGTEGNALANTPEDFASLWADYTFHEGALSGFGVLGGVRYVGQTYATNANLLEIPDYTLFDAGLHYELGELLPNLDGTKLAVNATNIGDKKYVSYCTAAGCRWGLGRTVYATLSYEW
ncbi:TonB-dependent siderophore receptor [Methyloligella sp. 2.7D]|uniref:TonB-dependent siderophore receptor n=1 Tax=unclassified Methyloligella TaxID=2625955 RepID=UPI00157CECDD|nr:TonB-dependent siderophore receptor [Methyloligella sp. GL2]QKP77932.1 TonB-dependent siderophore receptor [Methyloligella sp. GL2]